LIEQLQSTELADEKRIKWLHRLTDDQDLFLLEKEVKKVDTRILIEFVSIRKLCMESKLNLSPLSRKKKREGENMISYEVN